MVWIGLPPMKNSKISEDLVAMNEIYKESVQRNGGAYVDIWPGFVDDENRYTADGPDVDGEPAKLRTNEGMFFTRAGSRKVAFFADTEIKRILGQGGTATAAVPPGEHHARGRLGRAVHRGGDSSAAGRRCTGDPALEAAGRAGPAADPPGRDARRNAGLGAAQAHRGQCLSDPARPAGRDRCPARGPAGPTISAGPILEFSTKANTRRDVFSLPLVGRARVGVSAPSLHRLALTPPPPTPPHKGEEGTLRDHLFSPRSYAGRMLEPIRKMSMERAAWRPSRIAQTTRDWPRRMSPATKTFSLEVR